ncbi:MAG: UbiA prenyltransferase family-domain-containing protein [Piptocephalis tieghemiana]|nr:MAG: UbiA prenyltransferase family-domain-containing protein [Piptocephalis tieghemiana]
MSLLFFKAHRPLSLHRSLLVLPPRGWQGCLRVGQSSQFGPSLPTTTSVSAFTTLAATASLSTLAFTTLGTSLCVASANAFNQWTEVPFDAQMVRTRNRLLVRQGASPLQAFSLAVASGAVGVGLLAAEVNGLTALLGLGNIFLYAGVYTPMKRLHIGNTWAGALVGALPPMMGWAACTGSLEPGAWLAAYLLYAWQFPHFNALSWRIREDYARAGYNMTVVRDPALNARVALRYSLSMLPIALIAPAIGLTTPFFTLNATLVNAYMCIEAWRFWKKPNDKSSRRLFFSSLIHLPVLFGLLLFHKQSPGWQVRQRKENE